VFDLAFMVFRMSSVAIHWRSLHPLCYRHPVVTTLLQRLETERRERREELRQAVRAGLRDALRELLPQTPVRLFGSITQPYRFNEHSDVDLALEAEVPGLSIYQLISLLSERVGRRVDVLLLPECRFRDTILAQGELWTPPH
jgi:predicted nucleotidyltransferase